MTWKSFVGPLAITSRRKVLATAFMYGLSLTVRSTSETGNEAEISMQVVQRPNPMTSIMMKDGGQIFYKDFGPKSVQQIFFHRGWSLASSGCRAACERPMPMSFMPDCLPP